MEYDYNMSVKFSNGKHCVESEKGFPKTKFIGVRCIVEKIAGLTHSRCSLPAHTVPFSLVIPRHFHPSSRSLSGERRRVATDHSETN